MAAFPSWQERWHGVNFAEEAQRFPLGRVEVRKGAVCRPPNQGELPGPTPDSSLGQGR